MAHAEREEWSIMDVKRKRHRWLRFVLRWTLRMAAAVILVALAIFFYVFSGALYRHFVVFPREAKDWAAIRSARTEVEEDDGWQEFRGVCHSHSELSHDSEVPFPDILAAAKRADISFICMSDHPQGGRPTSPRVGRGSTTGCCSCVASR